VRDDMRLSLWGYCALVTDYASIKPEFKSRKLGSNARWKSEDMCWMVCIAVHCMIFPVVIWLQQALLLLRCCTIISSTLWS